METLSPYPQFRHYYRSFTPLFKKPKVQAYTMLVLSFFTVSLFGIFAIRPTLATIAALNRKIDDQKSINERMVDKIKQLRIAEVAYQNLRSDFDVIFAALPDKPQLADLLGKLNYVLVQNKIDVTVLQITTVPVTTPSSIPQNAKAFEFSVTGKGSYDSILAFVDLLSRTDRILTLDNVTITKEKLNQQQKAPSDQLSVSIKGKAYVLWEKPPTAKTEKGGANG